MTEKRPWEDKDVSAFLQHRGLDNRCPPLKPYLYSGARVLDIGCGPGTITMEVATQVHPGSVVGIDRQQLAVEQAIELANKAQVNNVVFQAGNAYALEFAAETFDISYCHALLEWLSDPIRALKEQKRVTKRSGWVIAILIDWGSQVIYPDCPTFEKVCAAFAHLSDPLDTETFVNLNRAREALSLFSQAGFKEIKLEGFIIPNLCIYPGSEHFDERYEFLTEALLNLEGAFAPWLKKLITLEILAEETILSAKKEIEEWYTHPHAFKMIAGILAAARAE